MARTCHVLSGAGKTGMLVQMWSTKAVINQQPNNANFCKSVMHPPPKSACTASEHTGDILYNASTNIIRRITEFTHKTYEA